MTRAGSHVAPASAVRANMAGPARRVGQPIPHRIRVARVERVRGEGVLVVEEGVVSAMSGTALPQVRPPSAERATSIALADPAVDAGARGRQRHRPRGAVGAEGNPGVRRAIEVAAVGRRTAAAAREGHRPAHSRWCRRRRRRRRRGRAPSRWTSGPAATSRAGDRGWRGWPRGWAPPRRSGRRVPPVPPQPAGKGDGARHGNGRRRRVAARVSRERAHEPGQVQRDARHPGMAHSHLVAGHVLQGRGPGARGGEVGGPERRAESRSGPGDQRDGDARRARRVVAVPDVPGGGAVGGIGEVGHVGDVARAHGFEGDELAFARARGVPP